MRIKSTKQQYVDFSGQSRLKVVNEYRENYGLIPHLFDGLCMILVISFCDLFNEDIEMEPDIR